MYGRAACINIERDPKSPISGQIKGERTEGEQCPGRRESNEGRSGYRTSNGSTSSHTMNPANRGQKKNHEGRIKRKNKIPPWGGRTRKATGRHVNHERSRRRQRLLEHETKGGERPEDYVCTYAVRQE